MSKLLINTNRLKNQFMPCLNDSINELISAEALARSLDIPNDFSYYTYLSTLNETIGHIKSDCVMIKDFVTNSIIHINNTSLEVCDLFDKIVSTPIKEREQKIK